MRARVNVEQSGSGEALVLIHGIATDLRIWDAVVPELAASRRVITLDLPGFGASAPPGAGFELEAVALRVARALAARGISGPLDLVGHSLGGGVAITLAAARPALVRRLILVAPAGLRPFPAPVSRLLSGSAELALATRRRAAPLSEIAWGRRLLMLMTAADGGALDAAVARRMVQASAGARRTAAALATITSADLRPLLGELAVALGVIWGERDRTIPVRLLDQLRALRPDLLSVTIAHAGHVPMVERPREFCAALERLLRELPLAQQPLDHAALLRN